MSATKCQHVAHIDEDSRLFLDRLFERSRRKTWNARKISEHFRAFRVYPFHNRVVMRDRWRGINRKIGEAFRVGELQKFIEFPLVTDRAAQASADIGAAR